MSDTAPAAAPTGTPAATNDAPNPADNAGGAAGDPSQTPDFNSQINAILKQANMEFKAGGKSHKVEDIQSLLRLASKGKPIEDSFSQLEQQRAQLQPIAQLIQQLKSDDPEVREQVISKLIGRDQYLALAEASLRRKFAEEQEDAKLSPQEKSMKAQLRGQQEKLAEFERMKEQQRQAQEQAKHEQMTNQYRAHISQNVGKALELMDLPVELNGIAVDFMKPIMRQMLSNNIPLDPQYLAERVGPIFDKLLQHKTSKLEGEKLLKFLGEDVGKRYRKALLGQMQPKQPPKPAPSQKPEVKADKGPATRFRW